MGCKHMVRETDKDTMICVDCGNEVIKKVNLDRLKEESLKYGM